MNKLALIGSDVSKSQSRQMHSFICKKLGIEITFDYFSITKEELSSTITNLLSSYKGFNITVPYKEQISPYLQSVDAFSKKVKSINTVNCQNLSGHNTDGLGFMLMLKGNRVEVKGKNVLVLGAGGAAKSCIYKLIKSGANVFVYNRTQEKAKQLFDLYGGFTVLSFIDDRKTYDIIVNTTSVGMGSLEGQMPVEVGVIQNAQIAVDLIYNPPLTKFLQTAKELGKTVINGKAMLFYQAYYADCIFFNLHPCQRVAKKLFNEYNQTEK